MSIENIIDYVIKTPQNTNPNVIRSLVKSEVDENTLQKAKEYTDSQRLAYTDLEMKMVFQDTLKFSSNSGTPIQKQCIEKGKTYVVKWHDKEYTCESFDLDVHGNPTIAIGNGANFGGTDTGEPFIIMTIPSSGMTVIGDYEAFWNGVDTEHTVSILEKTETIHPIDPKFLPSGVGGVTPRFIRLDAQVLLGALDARVPFSDCVTHQTEENAVDELKNALADAAYGKNDLTFVLFTDEFVISQKSTCYTVTDGVHGFNASFILPYNGTPTHFYLEVVCDDAEGTDARALVSVLSGA